jgi:hypothetical protein
MKGIIEMKKLEGISSFHNGIKIDGNYRNEKT